MLYVFRYANLSSVTCYLALGAKVAHKASTLVLHRFLSCAAVWTSLQGCHLSQDLSIPLCAARLFWSASFSLSFRSLCQDCNTLSGCCLRMCPMNCHVFLFISLLNLSILALSNSSLLLTFSCHLNFIILLKHRFWNTSIFSASPLFIFHVS